MRYSHVFALLVVILATFFWRPLFLGEVIFPHDNDLELGIAVSSETDRISNRKFSDQSSQYIPYLHHQLNGHTEAWISTWNPHVELGRPSIHVGGISKAFWLTHALSWVCKDAFRVYTWLVVFAIGATGCDRFCGWECTRSTAPPPPWWSRPWVGSKAPSTLPFQ